ncbi:hypothetical protein APSETT444_002642 [Aspergillus pseudonomiae]
MVFTTSPTVQSLPFPPDSIPISDLIFDDKYGRCLVEKSPSPFICGLTGNSYSFKEYEQRADLLSRGLSKDIGWQPNQGTELHKVIAIFSVNTAERSLGKPSLMQSSGGFATSVLFPNMVPKGHLGLKCLGWSLISDLSVPFVGRCPTIIRGPLQRQSRTNYDPLLTSLELQSLNEHFDAIASLITDDYVGSFDNPTLLA